MKVFHPSVYILLCLFSVTILFSQNNGKSNSNNSSVKRNAIGAIIGGDDNICAGTQTQYSIANLSNHSGHSGNWSVSNKLIATVNNNGLVTALRAGIFILKYDSDDSNCKGDSYRTILVNSAPTASITGSNSICINGTTTLFPIIGGTWSSSNTAVATVNNFGIVKGIGAGSATFTFTNLAGCSSAATSSVVVNAVGNAVITGESTICINETTTLSPSIGGTWTSSNKAVATVSNTGVVTGISSGSATFTFTKTGSCSSLPTPAVKINAKTPVSITGKNVICKNTTTTLSPTSGGTWSSSNVNVATVSNNGVVTGLAAGKVTFTFTKTDGCSSAPTAYITIQDCPVASITGPSLICINGTTTLSPTTGGTWTSSNTRTATVTNTGVVKGISAGSVTFTYTKAGSCSSTPTPAVTVTAITPVRITGANVICINGTTTLSPTSGGTWSSNNSAVATVNNEGIVTGIAAGRTTFVFTKTGGCISPATSSVTINDCPKAIITGPSAICINGTTTLSPTTGGTWTSSNKAVAIITNTGVVKGISAGSATFTYTKTGSCNSLASPAVIVNGSPAVSLTGANVICINGTTTLSPSTGGTWSSSNTNVATVSNSGIVTGVSSGTVTFTFTTTSGCMSAPTSAVTISNGNISTSITGLNTICIDGTTTLSPSTGGTWSSNNTNVATVNNSGIVTGVSSGTATFTFTTASGCISAPTSAVTISNGNISTSITGLNTICIDGKTTLSPSTGGTWSSNNTNVATVNNSGIVTGVSSGTATFTFTTASGCISAPTSAITVNSSIPVNITGTKAICINGTTTLSPSTGGTWSSSNTNVATVNNLGIVTGVSSGTATFIFTSTAGCISLPTSVVTVNANPIVNAITKGSTTICVGSTTQFENSTSGGSWSITNGTGTATVNTTGLVTGVAVGTATINYEVDNGSCKGSANSQIITINAATVLPAITGPEAISISQPSQPFQNETLGGVWSIRNGSGSASITSQGIVQGTQAGTVEIVYTFVDVYGLTVSVSKEIIIHAATVLPAITGPEAISISQPSQPFQNGTPGGVWSIKNGSGTASITSQGIVQGTQAGTVEVVYTFVDAYGVVVSVNKEIFIHAATVLPAITGPDTVSISKPSLAFLNETSGGIWSIKNGSGTASITPQGIVQGTQAGTVEVVYTFVDPYGVTVSVSKEIIINAVTVLPAITGPDTVFVSKPSLAFQNETSGGIWSVKNGSGRATVTSQGMVQGTQAGTAEVVYTLVDSYGITVSVNKEITIVNYIPLTGNIIASIEKPTTLDTISFTFEPTVTTFSAKKSSSLLSASAKSASATAVNRNLLYKWLFHELDNVTLTETVTEPLALHRFPIPGNYRLILIVTDENGFETTFYRDVIVTQTCEPIIGKIKILN